MRGRDRARHWAGLAAEEEQHLVLILHTKQGINIIRLIKFPRQGLERIVLEIKICVCVCVLEDYACCEWWTTKQKKSATICLRTCTYSIAPGVFFFPVISFEKIRRYYSWLCLYWWYNAGGMSLVTGMAHYKINLSFHGIHHANKKGQLLSPEHTHIQSLEIPVSSKLCFFN